MMYKDETEKEKEEWVVNSVYLHSFYIGLVEDPHWKGTVVAHSESYPFQRIFVMDIDGCDYGAALHSLMAKVDGDLAEFSEGE